MTTIFPAQITAAEAILRPFITDPSISVAGLFLQAYNAFEDARPSRKAKVAKARQDEPEGFSAFYDVFPRHEARRDAAKAYCGALSRAPAGIILAGAQRYATLMAGTEPKFIKLPATYLRADCWKDEAPQLAIVPVAFEDCSSDSWLRRLEVWAGKTESPRGTWRAAWGPKPKEPGCKVPESAKTEYLRLYPPKGQKEA